MITLQVIRKLAASFPGTAEGRSYRTPGFRVGKRLYLRLHGKEEAIVVLLDSVEEQQQLIERKPDLFYITDHYAGHAALLVRPEIPQGEFREIMERAWRRVARKKDLSEFDRK